MSFYERVSRFRTAYLTLLAKGVIEQELTTYGIEVRIEIGIANIGANPPRPRVQSGPHRQRSESRVEHPRLDQRLGFRHRVHDEIDMRALPPLRLPPIRLRTRAAHQHRSLRF